MSDTKNNQTKGDLELKHLYTPEKNLTLMKQIRNKSYFESSLFWNKKFLNSFIKALVGLSWLEHLPNMPKLWVQSSEINPRSGHIQGSTNECINKCNNESMFLSLILSPLSLFPSPLPLSFSSQSVNLKTHTQKRPLI